MGPDTHDPRRDIAALLPDLRAFARFLVRDRPAADDLVQDTIVRALAAIGQFTPGTSMKAWLFTIQRNAFYEQVRRRRREAAALEWHGGAQATLPCQTSLVDITDLQRVIWTLPPLLRESLVLVGAQEMTYEEAAIVCGVPVGTVKARVSRARTLLARTMAEPSAGKP